MTFSRPSGESFSFRDQIDPVQNEITELDEDKIHLRNPLGAVQGQEDLPLCFVNGLYKRLKLYQSRMPYRI